MASTSAFTSMLGPMLTSATGKEQDTATALAGKVVGLYFSAHWCPPCRGFTPKLVESYKAIKASGKDLEIVFVSSDKSDAQFKEYLSEMPWLALPFDQREAKAKLSTKFKVRGIPSLVFLDTDGKVITMDGREEVMADISGANFPWTPKPLKELLGEEFVGHGGKGKVGKEAIEGKTLGLYFSAHWCPPCKAFTPVLSEAYQCIKKSDKGADMEIVFISSDRSEAQFNEYHADQPWLALPFANREAKEKISKMFQVQGIPSLVTIGPDGEVINASARGQVDADRKGEDFPWHPKPVGELSQSLESGGLSINECASLILLMEGCDDLDQRELGDALEKLAVDAKAAAAQSGADPNLLYFTAKASGPAVVQVRKMAKQKEGGDTAQMVILDLPGEGLYVFEGEVTADAVTAFAADFGAGKLKKEALTFN